LDRRSVEMEIDTKLLVLMLVFGIIESLSVSAIPLIILFIDISSILLMYISSFFLPAINIAITIIIFAVIYSIGKGVDLKTKLKSVTVSLSIGCFLGSLIGYSAYVVIPFFKGASWHSGLLDFVLAVVHVLLMSLEISLGLFFVSFTASALAYLRVNNN
jgi:hypothetical protein